METLPFCCSLVSCHRLNNLGFRPLGNNPSLRQSRALVNGRTVVMFAGAKSMLSFGTSCQDSYEIENLYKKEGARLLGLLEEYSNHVSSHSAKDNCNYYVADGNTGLKGVSTKADEVTKVLIPGLPEGSDGNKGSPISSCFWEWKPKLSVHYEKSGSENVGAPAVLFLPGFGVGTFHYEKQLRDLGQEYRVWALDFLGQGMSLPSEDPAPSEKMGDSSDEMEVAWGFGDESEPWAHELVYSVDLWRDQVKHFIEEVIGEPVYLVGNSLGGYVALYFAACNPQLVKGVTLLNATPFWGFLPNPIRSPQLSKMFPWAGTFPLPENVKKLTQFVWQKISDPGSIQEVLKQVYADHSIKVDNVFSHIIETTQHPAAAAAFASIMFAPKGQLSFQEALSRCKLQSVPICLMYGKEDPWVRPVWGLKVKRQLPEVPYYEISPAGHCPHDEVPEVVNYLLRGWIKNLESQGSASLPLLEELKSIQYGVSRELEYIKDSTRKSVQVHAYGSKLSVWNMISSFLKSRFAGLQMHSH